MTPQIGFLCTPRRLELLRHLASGLTAKEAATEMGCAYGTVRAMADQMRDALGVRSALEIVILALDADAISLSEAAEMIRKRGIL